MAKMNVILHRNDKSLASEEDTYTYENAVVQLSKNGEWFFIHEGMGSTIGPMLAAHPSAKVDMIEMVKPAWAPFPPWQTPYHLYGSSCTFTVMCIAINYIGYKYCSGSRLRWTKMQCPTCEELMRVLTADTPIVRIIYGNHAAIEANRTQIWVADPVDIKNSRMLQCPGCGTCLIQPRDALKANGLLSDEWDDHQGGGSPRKIDRLRDRYNRPRLHTRRRIENYISNHVQRNKRGDVMHCPTCEEPMQEILQVAPDIEVEVNYHGYPDEPTARDILRHPDRLHLGQSCVHRCTHCEMVIVQPLSGLKGH